MNAQTFARLGAVLVAAVSVFAAPTALAQTQIECTPLAANSGVEREVAILIDGSGSIDKDDWILQKNALAEMLDNADLVPQDGTLAIAVLQYSTRELSPGEHAPYIKIEHCLTQISAPSDIATLKTALGSIRHIRAENPNGTALTEGAELLSALGDPAAIEQRLCMLTDGVTGVGPDAASGASDAFDLGIERVSVAAFRDREFFLEADARTAFGPIVYGGGQLTFSSSTEEFVALVGDNCLGDLVDLRAIEVNQSVQDWNTSVELIEGKETFVRVFLQPIACPINPESKNASGLLHAKRGGIEIGEPLLPMNQTTRASFDCTTILDRELPQTTLNFRLRPEWLAGDVTLELEMPGGIDCGDGTASSRCSVPIRFEPTDLPAVTWLAIPSRVALDPQIPMQSRPRRVPKEADLIEQRERSQAMLPVADLKSTYEFFDALTIESAVVNTNAMTGVKTTTRIDGTVLREIKWYFWKTKCNGLTDSCPNERVHGIVDGGAGVVGRANALESGLPVSVSTNEDTEARDQAGFYRHHATHELLHNFTVPHTTNQSQFGLTNPGGLVMGPCNGVAPQALNQEFADILQIPNLANASNPSDWRALLGPLTLSPIRDPDTEIWGADAHVSEWEKFPDLAISDPGESWAVMSYCSLPSSAPDQLWISKTNYEQVINYVDTNVFDAPLPVGQVDIEAGWVVTGVDPPFATFKLLPMYQTPGPGPIANASGEFTVELIDGAGAVLEARSFALDTAEAGKADPDGNVGPDDEPRGFFVVLPVPNEPVAEVVIRRNGTELLRVASSASAPEVSIDTPAPASTQNDLDVAFRWSAYDDDDDTLYHAVDYSADDGVTWVPLAVDLTEPELNVPRGWLRGGANARYRVTTTDGMRSTTATSDSFEVANNPPTVSMQSPRPDQMFSASQALPLDVVAVDREDGTLADESIEWISNRDGHLGFGARLDVGAHTLSAGRHLIVARAVDSEGAPASDAVEVEISRLPPTDFGLPDFGLRLDPPTQSINPGESAELTVFMTSVNGFSNLVTLDVLDLPTGWTASLSRSTHIPDATATLTLTAPADALEESIPVVVRGTSGDLVRTTSSDAGVVFGLIPQCYGRITGIVTDAYTGRPIEGASVGPSRDKATTDATGYYETVDLLPQGLWVTARASWYYAQDISYVQVRCDDVTNVDVELVPILTGTVFGRVVVGIPDPNDKSSARAVTPTDNPIEGARVQLRASPPTDAEGRYEITGIPLGEGDNTPVDYDPYVTKNGYWTANVRNVTVSADTPVELDFALVEKCEFIVEGSGTAFLKDGQPAVSAKVYWYDNAFNGYAAIVDAAGQFEMPRETVEPGFNNSEKVVRLHVRAPLGRTFKKVSVDNEQTAATCGENRLDGYRVTVEYVPLPPVENFARISGYVRDIATGEPAWGRIDVRRATGSILRRGIYVSGEGFFDFELLVGTGEDTSEDIYLETQLNSAYWSARTEAFTASSTEPTTRDLFVQAIEFISIEGVLRDRETGEFLAGLPVQTNEVRRITDFTDEQGRYRLEGITPGEDNTPTSITIKAGEYPLPDADDVWYYGESAIRFAEPGQTLIHDFDRLRRCEGGAVSGVVVNAETLDPLSGVDVRVSGATPALSDADGRFRIERILPAYGNVPRGVEVRASKAGFVTATKQVTIFCGAEIFVEFGAPSGGFGEVFGTVTDDTSGDPIEGVFIGSGFGATTTSDDLGQYRLTNAPLASDGGARSWQITATLGLKSLSADIMVQSGIATQQDFAFASDPDLGLVIDDERTHFDPATRTLTSRSVLSITNTTDTPLQGPVAATILVDRAGVAMPTAAGADLAGRPVYFLLDAGDSLQPGQTASVELTFVRAAPLAFLYDVQVVLGDPTPGAAVAARAALGVIPKDADRDGDLWHDALDVCPTTPDPAQTDTDGDGVGDACPSTAAAPDLRAPRAGAEWIRLAGDAPDGALSVRIGEISEPVGPDQRFEISAPVPSDRGTVELIFEDATRVIAAEQIEIDVSPIQSQVQQQVEE